MTALKEQSIREVAKRNVEHKANFQAKVESNDNGEITGYAAIYDIVDLDGDIIRKGAFSASIRGSLEAGKIPLMVRHFRDNGDSLEAVGIIIEGKEDDIGFWIRAKLFNSQNAQEVRSKIKDAPNMWGMSVGWQNVQNGFARMENGGVEYNEMKLREVTLTLMPAQEATLGLTHGKSVSLEETLVAIESRLASLEEHINGKEELEESTSQEAANPEIDLDAIELDRIQRLKDMEI